jgi:hypothetical protein
MSDLVSGRYPDTYEEWLLDGKPSQPYRTSISRKDITIAGASGAQLVVANVYVYPVIVQQGDVIGAVSVLVGTATAATATHGWAALYTGTATTSTLLVQSADNTSGFAAAGLQKFTLATPYTVGAAPGGTGTDGPLVLGVALYNSSSGAGGKLDGMGGSSVAGSVAVTGQAPLVSFVALAATATAPSVLTGLAAGTTVANSNPVPYIVLSRS